MFFVLEPRQQEDRDLALTILKQYDVIVCDEEDRIVVGSGLDFALAEMFMQINYLQDGKRHLCHVCRQEIEETGEGAATCGHLTFTKRKG